MLFEKALEEFKNLQKTQAAYNHVLGVVYLDASTAAPKGSYVGRGQTMEIMSQITYDLMANPKNRELVSVLEDNYDSLDKLTQRELAVFKKEQNRMNLIPAQEYVAYNVLLNEAQSVWEEAKNNNNFPLFAPYLEKIVDYNRKFAHYYNPEMEPYDALLNEYEEGLNRAILDGFFAKLRETIVPLLEKTQKADKIRDDFLQRKYPLHKQQEFSEYLMDVLDMDRNYCAIAESEHPFTTNFNNQDVRITTHYFEDMVASSMYSVIHEAGHAIYELGCDDKYNNTILSGGASMGLHESQSRFFENIIGRSYSFVKLIYPKMLELFPEQLADVDDWSFYRAVNKAQPSLIRTEADELSYCLHVMVRYELEKMLISGQLSVADVPKTWNALYKQYLGIDVPCDKEGCLQDSHWSGGMIGYFPSYALGSAYGAQILNVMQSDLGDIFKDMDTGRIRKIKKWLKEKIHTHACFLKPNDLFRSVCGEFDAKFYTDYLTEKFTKIYDLQE